MRKISSLLLLLLTLFLVACGSSVEPEAAVAVVEAEKVKPQLIEFYTDW